MTTPNPSADGGGGSNTALSADAFNKLVEISQSDAEPTNALRELMKGPPLAIEEQRRNGIISDPLDSAILIYPDDPTTAAIFETCDDMAAICGTSAIEGVCIVMGEQFPPVSRT